MHTGVMNLWAHHAYKLLLRLLHRLLQNQRLCNVCKQAWAHIKCSLATLPAVKPAQHLASQGLIVMV